MSSFLVSYGEDVSCGYRNLKQLPFALWSTVYFMLKVLPIGDPLSPGLLTFACVFSGTL